MTQKLAQLLAAFDDDALASLASKGLVRRARKDLESGLVTSAVAGDDGVDLSVDDASVTIPSTGPAFASCSCPATGVCRHILAATLYLKDSLNDAVAPAVAPRGSDTDGTPRSSDLSAEILDFELPSLTRWAGKKTVREAAQILADEPVEIEEGAALLVRFPGLDVECRFFPGAGLDGALSSAPERQRKKLVAAAVIAYQRHRGVEVEIEAAPVVRALRETMGAPRNRRQILASAGSLAEEMVAVGLSHLSPTLRDRLTTLSVSALGVNLPRVSRSLRAVADEADRLLGRHAQGDESRLLLLLAEVYALCRALGSAVESGADVPALVGRHRSRYGERDALDLAGVAAWRWRTGSGYVGLSVLFRGEAGWYSWSDSRPEGSDLTFDPRRRYEEPAPWSGVADPRRMSHQRLRLTGSKANDENRLSGSERCSASALGDVRPGEVDFGQHLFDDWAALRRYGASLFPAGLSRAGELDPMVVVRPARWRGRGFDEVRQTFVWELADKAGEAVRLEVVYSDFNDPVIRHLERLSPSQVWGICARIVFTSAGLALYPLSVLLERALVSKGPLVLNPTLDPPPEEGALSRWLKRLRQQVPAALRSRATMEDAEPLPAWSAATESAVSALEDFLLRLAESGRRALSVDLEQRLRDLAARLRRLGLEALGGALASMADEPGSPAQLLRTRYLCQVHRQAAVRSAVGA